MVQISERLQKVAALVKENETLADIGTDHGYIPIYLVEEKRIQSALAMDVNQGPLERAREHIQLYGMTDYIQVRLSDGVLQLKPGEAKTIVVAGMGGGLVRKILTEGQKVLATVEELILQPQSEIDLVREFLREQGYQIVEEDMVYEDGKFYPMMRVLHADSQEGRSSLLAATEMWDKWDADTKDMEYHNLLQTVVDKYGFYLLTQKHPVLLQYLEREAQVQVQIKEQLLRQVQTEKIISRLAKMEQEEQENKLARQFFEERS